MLLPALVVLSRGELAPDRLRWAIDTLGLEEVPRTEGIGAAASIAHRSFADDSGNRLVLDIHRGGETGWVFALFFDSAGERPATGVVEEHRALLRDVVERLGLTLVEITPAATADEVNVPPPPPPEVTEAPIGVSWELPYDELDQMWQHVGLRNDAPREVKEVKLREVMRTPVWSVAPPTLRRQAEDFLRDSPGSAS